MVPVPLSLQIRKLVPLKLPAMKAGTFLCCLVAVALAGAATAQVVPDAANRFSGLQLVKSSAGVGNFAGRTLDSASVKDASTLASLLKDSVNPDAEVVTKWTTTITCAPSAAVPGRLPSGIHLLPSPQIRCPHRMLARKRCLSLLGRTRFSRLSTQAPQPLDFQTSYGLYRDVHVALVSTAVMWCPPDLQANRTHWVGPEWQPCRR